MSLLTTLFGWVSLIDEVLVSKKVTRKNTWNEDSIMLSKYSEALCIITLWYFQNIWTLIISKKVDICSQYKRGVALYNTP